MSAEIDRLAVDAALQYLADLTPEQQLTVFSRSQSQIASLAFPPLSERVTRDQDDEVTRVLTCPHCTRDVDGIDVVDVSWRTTSSGEADFEAREVPVWYDGYGDYEGLVYLCIQCGEPVALPEGWREV